MLKKFLSMLLIMSTIQNLSPDVSLNIQIQGLSTKIKDFEDKKAEELKLLYSALAKGDQQSVTNHARNAGRYGLEAVNLKNQRNKITRTIS